MNKPRILWTDDEIDLLRAHIIFLEGKGYELLTQFLSGQAESIHSIIQNPSSWDEHIYARGQRDALNYVLNLESILEARVSEKIIEAELEGP